MIIDNEVIFIQLIILEILRILVKSCFQYTSKIKSFCYKLLRRRITKENNNDCLCLYFNIINQGLLIRLYMFLLLFYCFESLKINVLNWGFSLTMIIFLFGKVEKKVTRLFCRCFVPDLFS